MIKSIMKTVLIFLTISIGVDSSIILKNILKPKVGVRALKLFSNKDVYTDINDHENTGWSYKEKMSDLSLDYKDTHPGFEITREKFESRLVVTNNNDVLFSSYTPELFDRQSLTKWGPFGCVSPMDAIGHIKVKKDSSQYYKLRIYEIEKNKKFVVKDEMLDPVHAPTVDIIDFKDIKSFSDVVSFLDDVMGSENRRIRKFLRSANGFISPHDEAEIFIPEDQTNFLGYALIERSQNDVILSHTTTKMIEGVSGQMVERTSGARYKLDGLIRSDRILFMGRDELIEALVYLSKNNKARQDIEKIVKETMKYSTSEVKTKVRKYLLPYISK